MRFVLFSAIGLFLWAGTISIKYPQQPPTVTASSGHSCTSEQSEGERLLEYLKRGTVTNIHDNGRILTIGLSPRWAKFPAQKQQHTYNTVACYARSLNRPFQFFVSPDPQI